MIAGPQIIPGYWQKPKETAASLSGGELRTGDVGFMDDRGWFYLVDRAKDMIVASGFKVWPREVEEVLYLHPAVREAAVIGISDPYRGETIKAVISLKAGHSVTAGEIKAFARERMAAYKYPRIIEIVEDLPKTTSGKIMRRLLQTTTLESGSPLRGAELELVSVTYPQLRIARRGARCPGGRRRLAATQSRSDLAIDVRTALRAAAGDARAAGRRWPIPEPRCAAGRERGLSRGHHRPCRK